MGVMPWSPLAGGFLSGKYRADATRDGRLGGPNPFGDSKFSARNWAILEVVRGVADELGSTPAAVALAWVMGQPGVASTLVGARTRAQLDDNLAALRVALTPAQRQRLDDASAPPPTFSTALTSPAVRRMVFGGHDIRGWSDAVC